MYRVSLFSLVWLVLLLEYSSPYLLPPSALPLQEVYHHASLPLAGLVGSLLTGECPNLSNGSLAPTASTVVSGSMEEQGTSCLHTAMSPLGPTLGTFQDHTSALLTSLGLYTL